MKAVIIGGGVSGLTSAIYLSRGGFEVKVFNKGYFGALSDSPKIENYPGFANGISGIDLLMNMNEQAINQGVEIIEEEIIDIDFENNNVLSETQEFYEYDYIIISTGCTPRKLEAININKFENKGVHYCAVCDGCFYENKNVIVVGGGNTALTEALYLSNIVKNVEIFVRRDVLRADNCLFEKVLEKNINILWNVEIQECFGDNELTKISYLDKNSGEIIEKEVDAIFVSIGFDKNLELIENKNIENYDNVYLNGDIVNKYHQAIIAAGKGAEIALEIIEKNKK